MPQLAGFANVAAGPPSAMLGLGILVQPAARLHSMDNVFDTINSCSKIKGMFEANRAKNMIHDCAEPFYFS